ncbi:hypothetical protein BCV70DRAFT_104489 [Testicularia cyperi]|uniref:Alpha/beta hydrolase fold-3 domain-containing protein n=1 Tax=Testicularia cyperi TaxID=1882483 RepID=A0A317XRU2_9BASI|nr:hypothetical protein BCV70DRAFT_104489 [Testicularia cyperi]
MVKLASLAEPMNDQLTSMSKRDPGLFPPTLIAAGNADRLFRDAENLASKLRSDGVKTAFVSVENEGHAFDKRCWTHRCPQVDRPLGLERLVLVLSRNDPKMQERSLCQTPECSISPPGPGCQDPTLFAGIRGAVGSTLGRLMIVPVQYSHM